MSQAAATSRPSVAVVGSGVAGLTAAHLLSRAYDVTVFEADDRIGGHAHTHELRTSDGGLTNVDTGFIVHNDRTYPNLLRLFGELGVPTQDSDMSMSVRCDGCGLEYAGAQKIGGLFPQASNVTRPAYLKMLGEVVRFHRHARRLLDGGDDAGDVTLGAFLTIGGYSRYFVEHFMIPVVSCVWSAGAAVSLSYPARYLFTFLDHHGMLGIGGSPQWRTVTGGSQAYVSRLVKGLGAVRTATPVRSVLRTPAGVEVRDDADAVHGFDRVVVATHPDQALALLADATDDEREVLGAFEYSPNEVWLHHDTSLLPRSKGARASWNYLKPSCRDSAETPVLVSYDMNRLQRLTDPDDWVVTLNGTGRVDPDAVVAKMDYEHPIYTPESVAAQRRLPALNTGVTAFAGAYHGWGFHEDGCVSGVRAAQALSEQPLGPGWSR
ncbi:NAD(P)/FAD-dependent oxidoreductase [Pseudonocardia sp. KRD291]|uniref:NAD(P)/FAD-dependent oxidoreductase n=1 Tax=Pseudonocardia sp. KRD291 TaxID=2792007 RepID=UPI001C4A603B|nr:FAD-dependent oxidoreductase [Pseudonocardia sp. KRD291]MBW0104744.1 FAD-dependent oxidoreductase [Pseudonocardia sp. KRD291]